MGRFGLADAARELLWPTRCVGCDLPGTLLCPDCAAHVPFVNQLEACPLCGAPHGRVGCTACSGSWDGPPMMAAMSYEGLGMLAVRAYKDDLERRLAPVLAGILWEGLERRREAAASFGLLSDPFGDFGSLDAVAFIPSTPAAFARRGFDPMEAVASAVADALGLPVADCLFHNDSEDQRARGREARGRNVAGSFAVAADVSGATLLLLDDVGTTGASMGEAARTLERGGARVPAAAVLARAW